jgi:hypothetical protein
MGFRSAFSWLLPVIFLNLLVAVGCGSSPAKSAVNTPSPSNNKTLTSLTLVPVNVSLNVNAVQQFTVTGTYNDGSQTDVTSSATWASSNAAVATVNASGLLNAIAPGTAMATASVGTVGATASVTVNATPKNLTSITITPSQLSIPQGVTQQLAATGHYSDNTQADLTGAVIWNSSNGKVATVSPTGALYAVGSGPATITASDNSIVATLGVVVSGTGTNVATWHYDNERSGLNPNETTLNPANVNASNFGKLFSYLVDGYIYAQPLYASNLKIGGASHNVVFVATENDSVYAFDADQYGTGSPLWQSSLLKAGETPQTGASITPFQGVTSTPVIDLASNSLYVISAQQAASSTSFRLHALDLITGTEKFGGPVAITASVPGTNSDSVNGVLSLTTSCVQRAALLLADNTVFAGFGDCHSGWLLAYDAQTLAQTGVFNMSPNIDGYGKFGGAGGVWMGGAGPAADSSGNIYVTTGNGPYDGLTSFGDSLMKFNAQLKLLDHFTPDDFAFLQCKDEDLAAGGVLLLPGTSEALVGGKTGKMYLVNTGNLGGEQANDAGATQWLWFEQDLSAPYSATCTDNKGNILTDNINSYQIYGTAAFFNGSAYLGITPSVTTTPGPVRQFTYAGGKLTPGPITPDSIAPNSYGTTPFISANGTGDGIVWVLDHGLPLQNPSNVAATSAILRAYDATDLTDELYNSAQNAADAAGLGIKFTSPIVSNGKVFIGTGHDPVSTANPRGELDVYGLK